MRQEVRVPWREHQLLYFHGNSNESSLPCCLGHLLYEMIVGEHTVIFGPVFKVSFRRREHSKQYGVSEQGQLASPPSFLRDARTSDI